MSMKDQFFLLTIGSGLLACAPASTPVEGAAEPVRSASVAAGGEWSANIQPVQSSSAEIRQSSRARSYGTSAMSRGSSNNLTNLSVVFTHSGNERFLSWAVLVGSCGSPAVPLLPVSSFPELQVGSGGRSQATVALPIEFPVGGNYHINIYRERQQSLEGLVACGNYRRARA